MAMITTPSQKAYTIEDITLTNNAVANNTTAVGNFASVCNGHTQELGDKTFTYTLVAGNGNGNNNLFTINANGSLAFANNATAGNKSIRVRSTSYRGAIREEEFTITVT